MKILSEINTTLNKLDQIEKDSIPRTTRWTLTTMVHGLLEWTTHGLLEVLYSCAAKPWSQHLQTANRLTLQHFHFYVDLSCKRSLFYFPFFTHQLQMVLGKIGIPLRTHGGDNMSFSPLFSYSSFSLCSRGNKITTLLLYTMNFSNSIVGKKLLLEFFSARIL